MKYFDTLIEDQETTISILYKEQLIRIYSSENKTIQRLIKLLGQPSVKYKKSKTYWSGASWDIDFFELDKLKEVLYRDTFIDKKLKPIIKEEKKKTSKKGTKKINDNKEEKKSEKKVIKKNAKSEKKTSKVEEKKTASNVTRIKPKDIKKSNTTQRDKTIKVKAKKIKSDEKFEQIQFMF